MYENYGMHKDILADLVLFYSSMEKKMVTFDEYIAKMGEEQKYIYYAAGESVEKIDMLPQTEYIKEKGYEILYLTDEIDEFVLQMIGDYKEKEFKSVAAEDIIAEESEEQKEAMKKAEEENQNLLAFIKESLAGKVEEVKLSLRLKGSAVCLTTKGYISLEMEKTLNAMPMDQMVKADRILELNPNHEVFAKMKTVYAEGEEGKKLVKMYADLLYNQSLLISGLSIEDPIKFGEEICKLIVK